MRTCSWSSRMMIRERNMADNRDGMDGRQEDKIDA